MGTYYFCKDPILEIYPTVWPPHVITNSVFNHSLYVQYIYTEFSSLRVMKRLFAYVTLY